VFICKDSFSCALVLSSEQAQICLDCLKHIQVCVMTHAKLETIRPWVCLLHTHT